MTKLIQAALSVLLLSSFIATPLCMPSAFASEPSSQSSSRNKLLSENETKGIAYLVSQQDSSGGWAQGEESAAMKTYGEHNGPACNVADTSMAALALARAGNFPNSGKYAGNVERAATFVIDSIEKSDDTSMFVSDVRGTRVQTKLGPYIDTFMACLFLAEVKGRMPTSKANRRLESNLQKVVLKIQRNQGPDGQWQGGGWAPIHAQAMASKGLNRAKQVGIDVSDSVLNKIEESAKSSYNPTQRGFSAGGTAGIPLYGAAANLGSLQQSINTGNAMEAELRSTVASKGSPAAVKEKAQHKLSQLADARNAQGHALDAVRAQLTNDSFLRGFGCNGGEEYLSYLHISETLLANNDKDYGEWNKQIANNIYRVQNEDGSWMGHHCITSRTFCTAAALLVLLADRAPVLTAHR